MRDTVHLYVFEGFADWEAAFAVAGINNPRFQREPGRWHVRTTGERAALGDGIVRSMGGIGTMTDVALDGLRPEGSRLLILPGGDGWEDPHAHGLALRKAAEFIAHGVAVAAICGATGGLARVGLLDDRPHTSNAASYLKGTGYGGAAHYRDEPCVRASGVITAGGMAPIEFARDIFDELRVFDDEALDAWYQLYKTGKSEYFARMERAADTAAASS